MGGTDGFYAGGETAVHSEISVVDDGTQGQHDEEIHEMLVYTWGVFGLAWIWWGCTLDFEVEGGGHDSAFVVASEKVDGIGVGEF